MLVELNAHNALHKPKFETLSHYEPPFITFNNEDDDFNLDHNHNYDDSNNNNASPYNMSPWNYHPNTSSPIKRSPWSLPNSTANHHNEDYPPETELIGSLVRETGHIYSLAVSGELLYAGSDSKNIRVWKHLKDFTGFKSNSGLVKTIVISDGKIFTGHQDGKIRVWKVSSKNPYNYKRIGSLPTFKEYVKCSMNPKNYVEVRRNKNAVKVKHFDAISSLSLNKEEGVLYSGSWDKTLKVWRLADSKCLDSISAHDDAVNAVVSLLEGSVLTGSADGTVKLWRRVNVQKGEKEKKSKHVLDRILLKQENAVTALAVNCMATIVYCGSSDGLVNFWKCDHKGEYLQGDVLRGHKLAVLCLATAGTLIFSGSVDNNICVWRHNENGFHTCHSVLIGHTGPVKCIAVEQQHPQSEREQGWIVYTGSMDNSVKVWHVSEHVSEVGTIQCKTTLNHFDSSCSSPRTMSVNSSISETYYSSPRKSIISHENDFDNRNSDATISTLSDNNKICDKEEKYYISGDTHDNIDDNSMRVIDYGRNKQSSSDVAKNNHSTNNKINTKSIKNDLKNVDDSKNDINDIKRVSENIDIIGNNNVDIGIHIMNDNKNHRTHGLKSNNNGDNTDVSKKIDISNNNNNVDIGKYNDNDNTNYNINGLKSSNNGNNRHNNGGAHVNNKSSCNFDSTKSKDIIIDSQDNDTTKDIENDNDNKCNKSVRIKATITRSNNNNIGDVKINGSKCNNVDDVRNLEYGNKNEQIDESIAKSINDHNKGAYICNYNKNYNNGDKSIDIGLNHNTNAGKSIDHQINNMNYDTAYANGNNICNSDNTKSSDNDTTNKYHKNVTNNIIVGRDKNCNNDISKSSVNGNNIHTSAYHIENNIQNSDNAKNKIDKRNNKTFMTGDNNIYDSNDSHVKNISSSHDTKRVGNGKKIMKDENCKSGENGNNIQACTYHTENNIQNSDGVKNGENKRDKRNKTSTSGDNNIYDCDNSFVNNISHNHDAKKGGNDKKIMKEDNFKSGGYGNNIHTFVYHNENNIQYGDSAKNRENRNDIKHKTFTSGDNNIYYCDDSNINNISNIHDAKKDGNFKNIMKDDIAKSGCNKNNVYVSLHHYENNTQSSHGARNGENKSDKINNKTFTSRDNDIYGCDESYDNISKNHDAKRGENDKTMKDDNSKSGDNGKNIHAICYHNKNNIQSSDVDKDGEKQTNKQNDKIFPSGDNNIYDSDDSFVHNIHAHAYDNKNNIQSNDHAKNGEKKSEKRNNKTFTSDDNNINDCDDSFVNYISNNHEAKKGGKEMKIVKDDNYKSGGNRKNIHANAYHNDNKIQSSDGAKKGENKTNKINNKTFTRSDNNIYDCDDSVNNISKNLDVKRCENDKKIMKDNNSKSCGNGNNIHAHTCHNEKNTKTDDGVKNGGNKSNKRNNKICMSGGNNTYNFDDSYVNNMPNNGDTKRGETDKKIMKVDNFKSGGKGNYIDAHNENNIQNRTSTSGDNNIHDYDDSKFNNILINHDVNKGGNDKKIMKGDNSKSCGNANNIHASVYHNNNNTHRSDDVKNSENKTNKKSNKTFTSSDNNIYQCDDSYVNNMPNNHDAKSGGNDKKIMKKDNSKSNDNGNNLHASVYDIDNNIQNSDSAKKKVDKRNNKTFMSGDNNTYVYDDSYVKNNTNSHDAKSDGNDKKVMKGDNSKSKGQGGHKNDDAKISGNNYNANNNGTSKSTYHSGHICNDVYANNIPNNDDDTKNNDNGNYIRNIDGVRNGNNNNNNNVNSKDNGKGNNNHKSVYNNGNVICNNDGVKKVSIGNHKGDDGSSKRGNNDNNNHNLYGTTNPKNDGVKRNVSDYKNLKNNGVCGNKSNSYTDKSNSYKDELNNNSIGSNDNGHNLNDYKTTSNLNNNSNYRNINGSKSVENNINHNQDRAKINYDANNSKINGSHSHSNNNFQNNNNDIGDKRNKNERHLQSRNQCN